MEILTWVIIIGGAVCVAAVWWMISGVTTFYCGYMADALKDLRESAETKDPDQ